MAIDSVFPVRDSLHGKQPARSPQQRVWGRAGQPAELAPAYVLLASDEASYITGALIPVTGGRPML